MSSFRNHRVIIASLFLPTTAVLGESNPPTPDIHAHDVPSLAKSGLSTSAFQIGDKPAAFRQRSGSGLGNVPLKSIVEDLKDKSRAITPIASPGSESGNPFSRFASIASPGNLTPLNGASTPANGHNGHNGITSPRKYQTTHPEIQFAARIQRKQSRSSSRRPERFKFYKKEQHCSLPVWIPDDEFESCYDEFCHQVLWPCLHYAVPDAPKTKLFYESASFKQYVSVNQRFADAIIANYQEGDIIWVNDYHLMLLPSLLRASPLLSNAPIGFFLHVAFPSSEIFRCLSVRESLLRGLLAADLVGFQTVNYARHFRQTVSRILALEALPKGIQVETGGTGRFVDVGVIPMGIDVNALREKKREPDVSYWVQLLRQRYAGMKIVVGRDKLDEVQGVRHKIQAFEQFLDKHPEFQQKVVLIQVALQTTESNELAGGVADIVSRINSRFSTLTYQPVVFLHTQEVTFSQYLALLSVADAFLVTSLREGMALRTHEFVECQEGRHRPLILSEFTGSYSYSGFRSCIAINPYDSRGTAKAIYQALTMSDEEALSRWKDLHNHVVTQTAQTFVTSFLTRCLRANTEHIIQSDLSVVPQLDTASLLPRYKHSAKRLLLLDFEGAIWQRDMTRAGLLAPFEAPKEALALLNKFAEDPMNEVWLLSGLPVKGVMDKVAAEAPNVGIVAENGCFIRTRPNRKEKASWINVVSNFNFTWKASCVEILNYFTERTPGAFVEEREASVVWRFWTGPVTDCADRQWARRQAAEAQNHIFDSLGERYGLRIIPGANSFLVLPNNISRSTAVGAILHPGGPAHSPLSGRSVWMSHDPTEGDGVHDELDFVFAVGGDEKLLRRLNDLDNAETCSTSRKGTGAKWKLEPKDAIEVLSRFANVR
ncbi:glycosyltransferase family 20 protein [Serpula lacrymans var. lacrymans S7.9]|uniref:Glycosyltransferase family 20 protein n=1 Tax=Serpula lacrymans var. lacrymans (strain S7.9) TaxID=578457 RepID=F8NKK1_SERL9|nr:glycosyltransferase family 20 protein [Serpula lacrymans var. lacrymans S7.9]EGO28773.1 glycosyltransferase family 20 protein [Serpula lacrymans var. lacrymans S7.9]